MADFESTSAAAANPRHKSPRTQTSGVRIDMTPMVDVIMLLLTFFMLTTTLAMPQVMQINLPKGDETVAVNMGNVLNIRVSEKGNIFFSQGFESGKEAAPEKVRLEDMSEKLVQVSKSNEDLLLLLKFDRSVKYETMVDVLDEVNNSVEKERRRFSIKKLEDADKEIIRLAEAQ